MPEEFNFLWVLMELRHTTARLPGETSNQFDRRISGMTLQLQQEWRRQQQYKSERIEPSRSEGYSRADYVQYEEPRPDRPRQFKGHTALLRAKERYTRT